MTDKAENPVKHNKAEAPGSPSFIEREQQGTAPKRPEDYSADERITPPEIQTGEKNPRVTDPGAAADAPEPEDEPQTQGKPAPKGK